jgi:hypothetical protein
VNTHCGSTVVELAAEPAVRTQGRGAMRSRFFSAFDPLLADGHGPGHGLAGPRSRSMASALACSCRVPGDASCSERIAPVGGEAPARRATRRR